MPALPPRLSLEQVRRLAKDLLRDLKDGDRAAIRRLAVVSAPSTLAGAQLAIAREYGFPSWARLKRDVELREILDSLDVGRLRALVAEEPDLASTTMEHWVDHPAGASPLGYVAMLRYDTTRGIWREVDGAGAIAGILVAAGAPVDGQKGVPETPLITAASYGDAGVARVLIGAGADLEARASDVAGGVPGGTALLHAAVFGMSDVVDVLVEAGARIEGIEVAAAVGDVTEWLAGAAPDALTRALVMAARHERLDVIDRLLALGTPVDAVDPVFGGHPLRAAAQGWPPRQRRTAARRWGGPEPARQPPSDAPGPLPEESRRARGRRRLSRGRGHPRPDHATTWSTAAAG